jgi:hypothetical protein
MSEPTSAANADAGIRGDYYPVDSKQVIDSR